MTEEPQDQKEGADGGDQDTPVRPLPVKPESQIGDAEEASFRVIQDTVGRLIRRELQVVRQEIRAELHIGPLPHEKTLEAYERIVPGSARMIFTNFEEQGRHRRKMESYPLVSGNYRSFAGLGCGLLVTLCFLFVSYLLIKGGHGWEGTVLGTVDLVGLVAVFVYGSNVLRDERIRKARIMTGGGDENENKDQKR